MSEVLVATASLSGCELLPGIGEKNRLAARRGFEACYPERSWEAIDDWDRYHWATVAAIVLEGRGHNVWISKVDGQPSYSRKGPDLEDASPLTEKFVRAVSLQQ
jgi:hypothetical protein